MGGEGGCGAAPRGHTPEVDGTMQPPKKRVIQRSATTAQQFASKPSGKLSCPNTLALPDGTAAAEMAAMAARQPKHASTLSVRATPRLPW